MQHARLALIPLIAALMASGAALHAQGAGSPRSASLGVTVTGLHSARGQLIACLWKDGQGFPSCQKSRTAERLVLPVNGTTMHLSFPSLVPGSYAVTVQHDENGDGRMQHNFIGMPTEGVGTSNNPGGMPGYGKSQVSVGAGSAITVQMRYLFG